MASSFVTRDRVRTGLTLREACDAAVRFSDGTAGNLLLREIGGPAGLTKYLRGLGDEVTRVDGTEPHLARTTPGDLRDTTHPRAIGTDYREIVLADALPRAERAFLRDLLERNTTGDKRIRAGLPRDWAVADRTGTGAYGAANEITIRLAATIATAGHRHHDARPGPRRQARRDAHRRGRSFRGDPDPVDLHGSDLTWRAGRGQTRSA